MRKYRYVKLDPTGNITCLVLDPADPADEQTLTRELLKECEQVAYLGAPVHPGAVASVRLMGGEFCGNAAMAAAAWLVREQLPAGREISLLLDISGTGEPVLCTVRKSRQDYEGTVSLPPATEIREENRFGVPLTLVRMEGIVHLVYEGEPLNRTAAEELLTRIAAEMPDRAAGLLQWDRAAGFLRPLVRVRGSNSMVWENGCGSGSAAIGALETLRAGGRTLTTPVEQPGGVIRVTAETDGRTVESVRITGQVRLGTESVIELP